MNQAKEGKLKEKSKTITNKGNTIKFCAFCPRTPLTFKRLASESSQEFKKQTAKKQKQNS